MWSVLPFSGCNIFAFLSYLKLFRLFYYIVPQPYYVLKYLANAEDIKEDIEVITLEGLKTNTKAVCWKTLIARVMHWGSKAKLRVNRREVWP